MNVQQRSAIEKRVILKLIEIAAKHGYVLHSVHDGEERHKVTTPEAAWEVVDSVEESHIYFKHPDEEKRQTVFVVLGNDGYDAVADCSCGMPAWDKAMQEHGDWIDANWQ